MMVKPQPAGGTAMDDAAAQLRRLMLAIPALADDRPYSLTDLAASIGTDPATLARDLRTLVTRVDDGAPGWVESVQLIFDHETVQLHSQLFRRPMGLTHGEWRALELGLAMVQQEVAPDEQPMVFGARQRVGTIAMRVPVEPVLRAGRTSEVEQYAQWLTQLRRAIRRRRVVRIEYRSAASPDVTERAVHPYGVVFARGRWFLVAYCARAEEVRVFRIDRIQTLQVEAIEAPPPADGFSLDATVMDGRVLQVDGGEMLRIRYTPHIARWIIEREGGEPDADGSVVREYPLADDEWAVRHVLQYGPDGEVLGPARIREAVRLRLTHIVAGVKT